MEEELNKEASKLNRKTFLIECASARVEEANSIIDNASNQCSNLKLFFITLGVPATISLFAIYYGFDKSKRINNLNSFPWIAFILSLVILLSITTLYYSFYLRQNRYRKVKESIERLKENLIIEIDEVNVEITSENFTTYYKAINTISRKTTNNIRVFGKSLLDSLQITIPMALTTIFWLVVAILHCFEVSL